MIWKDCGASNRSVLFNTIDLQPQPVPIQSKDELNVSVSIILKEEVNEKMKLSVKIWRKFSLKSHNIYIPVPCILKLGSCDYDFCDFVEEMKDIYCPVLKVMGKPCNCPFPPDNYTASNVAVRFTKKIPRLIAKIGSGTYEVIGKLKNEHDVEIACAEAVIEIDMNEKT
ncbi:ganglioside GM2 activator-like protein [Leptotrombidium deliense]|uniref:Ganglioside GM2 activator-like protein n=1 Tax=Leptotrombidium deliense TaxID=299467 RepID=A0A443RXT8_9ACAR|nr:ganglioside GM2 activator-like protein [Leptotrombidium deliense]